MIPLHFLKHFIRLPQARKAFCRAATSISQSLLHKKREGEKKIKEKCFKNCGGPKRNLCLFFYLLIHLGPQNWRAKGFQEDNLQFYNGNNNH